MKSRLELQDLLERVLGSKNVYFQPPTDGMKYPAIKYSRGRINKQTANNSPYIYNTRYEITVIDKKPDNPAIMKILELPLTSYDRPYVTDNLYHDVITIYW